MVSDVQNFIKIGQKILIIWPKKIRPDMSMCENFGPYLGQILLFFNRTFTILFVAMI